MLSRFATLGGAPTDPYWANVSYLLVGNGVNGTTTNIKDSSSNNIATTIFGNTVISTTQSKYGSGSVYFDGSDDYLTLPNTSLLSFGTGDFTCEGWVYCTNLPASDGTSAPCLYYTGAAGILFSFWQGNMKVSSDFVADFVTYPSASIVNNGWFYFAITRSGTSMRGFINGTQIGGTTTVSNNLGNAGVVIGHYAYAGYNRQFQGYLYDFRVTKGVCRYTSTFTAPTAPFPTTGP